MGVEAIGGTGRATARARVTGRHAAVVAEAICEVLARHPELRGPSGTGPALRGWLGDPRAAVWFVTDRQSGDGSVPPVLLEALGSAGFAQGDGLTPDGWSCYLTSVVKSGRPAGSAGLPSTVEARIWAPVLAAQLRDGRPGLVVTLGRRACELLEGVGHLVSGLPPRWLAADLPDVALLTAVRRQSMWRSPSRATAASK